MLKVRYIFLFVPIALVVMVISFSSCKKDDDDTTTAEFDRNAMLTHIGNSIIVPSYLEFSTQADKMDSLIKLFATTTNQTNLTALRMQYKEAYLAWQSVSTFEFGPAEQLLLRTNTNTFPTDTTQIKSNISSGSYDLATASNLDAKGFPAIDYLLYGLADSVQLLSKYVSDVDAAKRLTYLKDICNEIKANANSVYTSWSQSGGNYITTFINSTGTDVGSSLGLLVNELNYDFEIIKNYEIAIPLGKKTLGSPLPEKVQAYYAGNSMQLSIAHFNAIANLYQGKNNKGVDGSSLDEYLIYLESPYNGGLLSDAIKSQLTSTLAKLENVSDPLAETILSNSAVVDAAYSALQQQMVLFKTDMPSALGILITYQDNDGD